jgi:predicted ATP-grasp superfamily ATP-dependent carboligase
MPKVLVLDGKLISALAIVRSLGRRGFDITCGEEFKASLGSLSKYVKNKMVYPSPSLLPDLFIENIYSLVKHNKYDMILPVADDTTLLLAKNKNKFAEYTNIPTPDFDTITLARDKSVTMKIAAQAGIPCPITYYPENQSIDEIKNQARYPVLIKPCESSGARGIRYVDNPGYFDQEYFNVKKAYRKVYIQEFIPNIKHYSICVLMDQNSDLKAYFAYQELRQYPTTGGSAAYAISVQQPQLIDYAVKLLKVMKWSGVANLEYVIDERDNSPKLIEINPRFWMSLELAIKAGVDFPYLLYQQSMNIPFEIKSEYKIGTKYRWLFPADILWLWNNKNKLSSYGPFLKFFSRDLHYAVLSPSDIGPSLGILIQSMRFLVNKQNRQMMFNRGW